MLLPSVFVDNTWKLGNDVADAGNRNSSDLQVLSLQCFELTDTSAIRCYTPRRHGRRVLWLGSADIWRCRNDKRHDRTVNATSNNGVDPQPQMDHSTANPLTVYGESQYNGGCRTDSRGSEQLQASYV